MGTEQKQTKETKRRKGELVPWDPPPADSAIMLKEFLVRTDGKSSVIITRNTGEQMRIGADKFEAALLEFWEREF